MFAEDLKFLNDFLAQTRESRNQRKVKNPLFRTFFYFRGPQLIPITILTVREHYRTCINPLVKFCHDLYHSF